MDIVNYFTLIIWTAFNLNFISIVEQDHHEINRLLECNPSNINVMLNQLRHEFLDELKKCQDQNRKEQEKLKMEIQNLEIYVLTNKYSGILKVILFICYSR